MKFFWLLNNTTITINIIIVKKKFIIKNDGPQQDKIL